MNSLYKKATLLVVGIFSLSCSDDFIDLSPVDSASINKFYTTEADFEAAIIGLYSNWRVATVRPPMLTEYRADNFTNVQYLYYELAENDLSPDVTAPWWNLFGQLVYPANMILDRIDEVEGIAPEAAERIKGEALFFRGYAYYWMNLVFGGVPRVTSVITNEEALSTPRASEEEIWQQAVGDFQNAAALLPATAPTFGRIDRYDAETFQARSLLQQRKWEEAVPLLRNIYENSGHALEEDWANMWSLEAEKNSNEIMLSSIWSDLVPNNDFAQQYLKVDGDPTTQGNFVYKPGLLDSFEEGDIRKDATVGVSELGFDQNNKYDYGKVLNNWTMDIVVLRFADVVLMYAEALTMAAGSVQTTSLELINQTRSRAGLSDLTMNDVPTVDAFVEKILQERRAELLFEATRFADLKRHDKLLEKLAEIGYNFNSDYLLLPIPQSEIDKMPDVLTQNPGYQ